MPPLSSVNMPPGWARMVAWVVLAPFQFGFGISELNALQSVWVCQPKSDTCLGMTEDQFGVVTAMFTIGGTISSLACAPIARYTRAGRKTSLLFAATLALGGGSLLSMSSSMSMMSLARFIQGLCAGIAIVQTPLYLKELAPASMVGSIGTLNQLAVVTGIFVAQLVGTWVVTWRHAWQRVPQVSACVAGIQLLVGYMWAEESPGWLESDGVALGVGSADAAESVRTRLGCSSYSTLHAQDTGDTPILGSDAQTRTQSRSFTDGMKIVALTQAAQQLSGVNAIMYYSTGIMSKVLPNVAAFVGLLITLVNAVMTLPPLWLIDEARFGRRKLLLLSATGMGVSCFVLALGLVSSYAMLSSLAILLVIAFFSVGLGPVPFVILPEVLPPSHVSIGSSLGLGINWITNICTALAFQPLRRMLGSWDGQTGGLVFVLFGGVNLGFASLIQRMYT